MQVGGGYDGIPKALRRNAQPTGVVFANCRQTSRADDVAERCWQKFGSVRLSLEVGVRLLGVSVCPRRHPLKELWLRHRGRPERRLGVQLASRRPTSIARVCRIMNVIVLNVPDGPRAGGTTVPSDVSSLSVSSLSR